MTKDVRSRTLTLYKIIIVVGVLGWSVSCSRVETPQLFRPTPVAITDAMLAEPHEFFTNEQDGLRGDLLYDSPNGKLWTLPVAPNAGSTAGPAILFPVAAGTFAFQPVWSPTNRQIAYGYILPDAATGRVSSARPWVANLDGSEARTLVEVDADFAGTYRDPAWAVDGKALWVTVQLPEVDAAGVTRFRSEIRRIDVATGAETVVIAAGRGPALSPDGRWVAYLAPDGESGRDAIWRAKADGSGTGSNNAEILVAGERFEEIYVPMRFSPDGQTLAFAAADAANQLQRTPAAEGFYRFFRPSIVYAHGLYPADVWLVDVETGKLDRLTQLSEDHPTPVWSPDGGYLAFAGVLGVYVIDVAERRAIRLTDAGVDGQIEWVVD